MQQARIGSKRGSDTGAAGRVVVVVVVVVELELELVAL